MSNVIIITNRKLVKGNFLFRLEELAKTNPKAIVLREKDLHENDYKQLAKKVFEICTKYKRQLILHSFISVAIELNCTSIHLPLPILEKMTIKEKSQFHIIGASCHSAEDARKAENLGATYISAGHIFETDCKKGLKGRGLDFLKNVCESVKIPVYAIGGINSKNAKQTIEQGASGFCVMSGAMQCEVVETYMQLLNI